MGKTFHDDHWVVDPTEAEAEEQEIEDFEVSDAGASMTHPEQCSALRKNGYVCIKGRPCKIVEMSTSKTGKHGHAKVHLVAIDIFTTKKLEELCPSTHNMDVPNVKRKDFQLISVSDDGFMSLLLENGDVRSDVPVPDSELGQDIVRRCAAEEQLIVTTMSAMGEEHAIAVKALPAGA